MHGTTMRAEARERQDEPQQDNRCDCSRRTDGYDARRRRHSCSQCAKIRADGGNDPRSPVSRIRNADEQLQHAAEALDEDEWSKASIQAIRSDLVRILSALEDDGEPEIVTDGGRDSPKGDIRITLGRDDVRHLMENGTTVLQKEVGPLTVNIRTHQRLEAVIMLAGRNVDPEPEVLED